MPPDTERTVETAVQSIREHIVKTALMRVLGAAATGLLALSLVAAHGDASTEAELSGFAEVGESAGNSPSGDTSGYTANRAPSSRWRSARC